MLGRAYLLGTVKNLIRRHDLLPISNHRKIGEKPRPFRTALHCVALELKLRWPLRPQMAGETPSGGTLS